MEVLQELRFMKLQLDSYYETINSDITVLHYRITTYLQSKEKASKALPDTKETQSVQPGKALEGQTTPQPGLVDNTAHFPSE